MSEACQVDFYLLGSAALDANRLACKLATMAWERGHSIDIVTPDDEAARALDEMLWEYPEGRFVPHQPQGSGGAEAAPIRIGPAAPVGPADVVINLTPEALEEASRFGRLLEIVPHLASERQASRNKFKMYRSLGLEPATHEIN